MVVTECPSYNAYNEVHSTHSGNRVTYQGRSEHSQRYPHFPLSPDENRVRLAGQRTAERSDSQLSRWANHVVELHEVCAPENSEQDSAEESTDKALYGLLGGELDERSPPKSDTPDICEDVIADDQRGRHPEPDRALQDIVDNEVTTGITCQNTISSFKDRYTP